jgi:hypothetical protein
MLWLKSFATFHSFHSFPISLSMSFQSFLCVPTLSPFGTRMRVGDTNKDWVKKKDKGAAHKDK